MCVYVPTYIHIYIYLFIYLFIYLLIYVGMYLYCWQNLENPPHIWRLHSQGRDDGPSSQHGGNPQVLSGRHHRPAIRPVENALEKRSQNGGKNGECMGIDDVSTIGVKQHEQGMKPGMKPGRIVF